MGDNNISCLNHRVLRKRLCYEGRNFYSFYAIFKYYLVTNTHSKMPDECVFMTNECALMRNTHSKMTDECVFFYDLNRKTIFQCLNYRVMRRRLSEE